jgi:hypothetical protein
MTKPKKIELILGNSFITKSKILGKVLRNNKISLSKTGKEKTTFIYHSFSKDSWSARWYNVKSTKNSFEWNPDKLQITYIVPQWEKESGGERAYEVIDNVPIVITFTPQGWNKFCDFYGVE